VRERELRERSLLPEQRLRRLRLQGDRGDLHEQLRDHGGLRRGGLLQHEHGALREQRAQRRVMRW
jgi:hypothetical protein